MLLEHSLSKVCGTLSLLCASSEKFLETTPVQCPPRAIEHRCWRWPPPGPSLSHFGHFSSYCPQTSSQPVPTFLPFSSQPRRRFVSLSLSGVRDCAIQPRRGMRWGVPVRIPVGTIEALDHKYWIMNCMYPYPGQNRSLQFLLVPVVGNNRVVDVTSPKQKNATQVSSHSQDLLDIE